jgi:outer membrane protein OmpA-like peptidoglycan-associated protein
MISALLTLLIPFLASVESSAQEPSFYIGLYMGASVISYSGPVSPQYLGAPSTIPPSEAAFNSGDGFGLTAGALIDWSVADILSIGARLGYQSRNATMTQRYTNTTDLQTRNRVPQPGPVDGNVETKLDYLNLTPLIRIRPFYFPIYFLVGPSLLFPMQSSYTYTETALGGGLVFRDRGTSGTRTLASRDIPTISPTLAATGGVGLELPFSESQGLLVELQYSPMLSDLADRLSPNEHWKADAVSGVVAFRYGFGGSEPPPPPPPPAPVVAAVDTTLRDTTLRDTTRTRVERTLPGFAAAAVMPEGLRDTLTITGDAVRATEVHALLPYIFFEQDSAVLPVRYAQVDKRGVRSFDLGQIPRGNTLNVYHELLNIIGLRMRDNRTATITLTGCVSQFEEGDTALSRLRAMAIRDYLISTWKVKASRIKVDVRTLPSNPSLSEVDTLEGARENQRVEIASSDYAILAPVMLPDSVYLRPAGILRFTPPPIDTGRTNDWTLDLQIGDSLIKNAAKGFGPPLKEIDVPIANRPDLDWTTPVPAVGILRLQDTLFENFATYKSNIVTLRQEGKFEEKREIVRGNYYDEYNLLLFSFDSAGVFDFSQQATSIMRDRITPNSRIRVIGHTDRIGLPSYNRNLSVRRAETAAELLELKVNDVSGQGEKNLLYDNTIPEGRYYCRTVTVIIETPVEGKPAKAGKQAKLNRQGGENE